MLNSTRIGRLPPRESSEERDYHRAKVDTNRSLIAAVYEIIL